MARPSGVWKHKSGCWAFRSRGKCHYLRGIPLDPKGKAQARREMERLIAESAEAAVGADDPTLGVLGLAFLADCRRRVAEGRLGDLTYRGHRKKLGVFLRLELPGGRTAGGLLARDLTATTLGGIVEGLERAGRKPNYLANMVGSLQAMLNWAARGVPGRDPEVILPGGNPVRGFERPKAGHAADRYANHGTIAAFLAWLDARAAASGGRFDRLAALMVRLIAETGCRPGEACAAVWDGVDDEGRPEGFDPAARTLTISTWKNARKTGKQRRIQLPAALAAALAVERDDPDRHPRWIFTHRLGGGSGDLPEEDRRRGGPWDSNAFSRRFKELREAAIADGLDLAAEGPNRWVAYLLRHSYITDGLMNGIPPSDLASLTGTSTQMVERVYGHLQQDHLRRRADEAQERRIAAAGG